MGSVEENRLFSDWEQNIQGFTERDQQPGIRTHHAVSYFFSELFKLNKVVRWENCGKVYYLNAESLKKFLLRRGVTAEDSSIDHLLEQLEKKLPEIYRLSSPEIPKDTSKKLPTTKNLIEEYRKRKFGVVVKAEKIEIRGYVPNHQKDQTRLIQVLTAHNQQFKSQIDFIGDNDAGFIQKVEIPANDTIFVRADLHSDLATLLGQLEMLKKEGKLDASYHCKPGFHMIFLGDYMDRGVNDIEVATLLLRLRMENPHAVHLIRGNHEDVKTQSDYSFEAEWIINNRDLLTKCYQSFPLALCVAEKTGTKKEGKEVEHQYMHFSHGLFSPFVDISPLLNSQKSHMVVAETIEKLPRWKNLKTEKQKKAAKAMRHVWSNYKKQYESQQKPTVSEGYLWSALGKTETMRSPRGAGYVLTPETAHAALRVVSTEKAKIKGGMVGHEHMFVEHIVGSNTKVKFTTLAVGAESGIWGMKKDEELQTRMLDCQGFLLEVHPKVKDWKKRLIVSKEQGFQIEKEQVGMYQRARKKAETKKIN